MLTSRVRIPSLTATSRGGEEASSGPRHVFDGGREEDHPRAGRQGQRNMLAQVGNLEEGCSPFLALLASSSSPPRACNLPCISQVRQALEEALCLEKNALKRWKEDVSSYLLIANC